MLAPRFVVFVGLLVVSSSTDVIPQELSDETPVTLPLSRERHHFKSLLLSNPNYFGNLPDSGFDPVVSIAGNTTYEELVCVGFEPRSSRLNGVVYVYQPVGYGGGVCTNGTPEYVRFYVSFDDGATWNDEGTVAFRAYDIPGTTKSRRLEYAVSLKIEPPRKFCTTENIALVRAILSWNQPPPPNQPNWPPVWGNVHNTYIQIQARPQLTITDLASFGELNIPNSVLELFATNQPLALATPTPSFGSDVMRRYKEAKVEPLRYKFPMIQNLLSSSSNEALSDPLFSSVLDDLGPVIDLDDILFPTNGNTSYENLECIGLNTNEDTLEAVIRIRRPVGYGGDLCSKGSTEYVTFWADFDQNGSLESCLGTASVRVHDIASIPSEGLEYGVYLPIDLTHQRRLCTSGPKVVRVRAILAWQSPPPCSNPNYVPTWGTRRDTFVHITPGPEIPVGAFLPQMSIVGGIPFEQISTVNGMTTADALFALNGLPPDPLERPCPFGRRVVIQGPQFPGKQYRVQVQRHGETGWTTVNTPLKVVNASGVVSTRFPSDDGVFTYLTHAQNISNVLAWWNTSGDGDWRIRIEGFVGGALSGAQTLPIIRLDNTPPSTSISISTGTGDCGKFPIGTSLSGTFTARDIHFREFSLVVKPPINTSPVGVPSPSSGMSQTSFVGDPWTLNTTGMTACGYIVEVDARDRSILNSATVGHYREASVGFCLDDE